MRTKINVISTVPGNNLPNSILEKYGYLIAKNQQSLQDTQAAWLTVSSKRANYIRDKLADQTKTAILEPNICTFFEFAEKQLTKLATLPRGINQLQKLHLIRLLISKKSRQDQLPYFSKISHTTGLLETINRRIAELKRKDVWAENYSSSAETSAERDLATLYLSYQALLHRGNLYDSEGCFWLARQILSDQKKSETSKYKIVIVDGFSDFTPAQYDILSILAARTEELCFLLKFESAKESNSVRASREFLFTKPLNTLSELKKKFPNLEIQEEPTVELSNPALEHLRYNLFKNNSKDYSPPIEGLSILAATGDQSEIDEIARRIKNLLRSDNAKPDEILVVFSNLNSVSKRIEDTFNDFGIPFDVEARPTLFFASPLIRTILEILELHNKDWQYRRLLSLITNRSIKIFDELDQNSDIRAQLEICIRAAQLPKGKNELLNQLFNWSKLGHASNNIEELPLYIQYSKNVKNELEKLSDVLEHIRNKSTLRDWVDIIENVLIQLRIIHSNSSAFSQVSWLQLRKCLLELANIHDWTETSHSYNTTEIISIIELISRNMYHRAEGDSVGKVKILSANSARHLEAKHVFLAGLGEQSYTLQNEYYSVEDSRSNQDLYSEKMFLFFELINSSLDSLTLSYSALDEKGQLLSPSPFISDIRDCFGKAKIPTATMTLGSVFEDRTAPSSKSELRKFSVAEMLDNKPQLLAAISNTTSPMRTGESILDALNMIDARSERENFGPFEGMIENESKKEALAKRFDTNHLWSPSQLESYASCPFRFYMEQVLTIEPLDDLVIRSNAARRGSLLHQVLANVHEELLKVHQALDSESELLNRFAKVLAQTIENTPLYGLDESLREIERREIETWAQQYPSQEREYRAHWNEMDLPLRPRYFEVRFGPKVRADQQSDGTEASTPIPFELDIGNEQILLTGQIDRVDVGQIGGVTVFNIIDYKSGKKQMKLDLKKVRSGHQLQLPIYALAAENFLFTEQEARALSAGYWNIRTNGFERKRKDFGFSFREITDQTLTSNSQWDDLVPVMQERIRYIINGIRKGQFAVYNEDKNCTSSCQLSSICRISQIRSLEKHWDVGELESAK